MLAMKPVVYESLFSNKTVFGRQTPFKAWTEWNIPQKTQLSHDKDPGFRDNARGIGVSWAEPTLNTLGGAAYPAVGYVSGSGFQNHSKQTPILTYITAAW